jgi:hypothetical protein
MFWHFPIWYNALHQWLCSGLILYKNGEIHPKKKIKLKKELELTSRTACLQALAHAGSSSPGVKGILIW